MDSWYRKHGKRIMDVVGSGAAIAVLSPVLLTTGALIKGTSRGPVFFLQERPGRDGKPFQILKFRSMLTFEDSYDDDGRELSNDERITGVGRVIRRFSIDELPQLINVLKGDMSLVGPRPALMYQAERYDDHERRRLEVLPGITGLAQVNGRNSLSWEEKIAYDVEYVDGLSFLGDMKIMLRTVAVVLGGAGIRFEKHDRLSEHNGSLRSHIGERTPRAGASGADDAPSSASGRS